MKKLFLFFTLLATFAACSKSEEGAENNNPNNNQGGNIPSSIEVESTDWVIAESGGYYYLDFYASDNWKAFLVNNSDWLSVVSGHGEAGNNKLKILVKENNGEDERRAAIKIVTNTQSVTINVTQKMKDALTVTKSKFEVKAEGDNIEVEIKANVEYDFSISESAKSWITHKSTRAMETSTLEFSVAANEDTKRREGKITIYSGNLKETITIYQEGLIKPSIVLTQSEYNVSDEENTISIEVTSGVDVHYEIIDDVDWVREITSRAISTTTFKFEIAQNNGYDSRSARIRFYNEGENLEEYVTINQMQKDAIVLAKDSYTITSDGGEIEVGIGHNVDFDVEIGCDWITRRDTRAFVTDKLTFVIDENNDYDDREGTIIFNSKDGTLSQTVKVYQIQRDAIVLAKDSYTITSDGGEIEVGIGHNVDFDVEIGCDWITRRDTRAFVTDKLTFVIDENNDYDDREGTIIFNSKDGTLSQTVKVYQIQRDAIVLAKDSYTITSDGGEIEVGIGYNIDFDVEIGCDWITQTSTRALENKTLVFTIAANSSTDNREEIIKFISKDEKITQLVSIYQSGKNALVVVSQNHIAINYQAQSVGFEVSANVEYVVSEPSVDWLHRQDTRGMNTQKYTYQVDENTTDESRTATITIQSVDGAIEEVVTITQAGFSALKIEIYNGLDLRILHNQIAKAFGAYVSSIEKQDDRYVIRFNAGYNVIPEEAFRGCNWIRSCEMFGIKTIGNNAFRGCRYLTSVVINYGIVTIGDYAFSGCSSLTSITIPGTKSIMGVEIGNYAFEDCDCLTSVTFSNKVKTIGDYAFSGCSGLTSITIPDSVISIGSAAFSGCSGLTSVTVPGNVTSFGSNPFYCIGGLIAFYGEYASNDNRCLIKDGKLISFAPSGLTKYDIPDDVSEIGDYAFRRCGLTSITIPYSVTEIGKYAFGDNVLSSIYCMPTIPPTTSSLSFDVEEIPRIAPYDIYVPAQSLDLYEHSWQETHLRLYGYYF